MGDIISMTSLSNSKPASFIKSGKKCFIHTKLLSLQVLVLHQYTMNDPILIPLLYNELGARTQLCQCILANKIFEM